jgi:hypothetical protein
VGKMIRNPIIWRNPFKNKPKLLRSDQTATIGYVDNQIIRLYNTINKKQFTLTLDEKQELVESLVTLRDIFDTLESILYELEG